jgi:hypothetical protein
MNWVMKQGKDLMIPGYCTGYQGTLDGVLFEFQPKINYFLPETNLRAERILLHNNNNIPVRSSTITIPLGFVAGIGLLVGVGVPVIVGVGV